MTTRRELAPGPARAEQAFAPFVCGIVWGLFIVWAWGGFS